MSIRIVVVVVDVRTGERKTVGHGSASLCAASRDHPTVGQRLALYLILQLNVNASTSIISDVLGWIWKLTRQPPSSPTSWVGYGRSFNERRGRDDHGKAGETTASARKSISCAFYRYSKALAREAHNNSFEDEEAHEGKFGYDPI